MGDYRLEMVKRDDIRVLEIVYADGSHYVLKRYTERTTSTGWQLRALPSVETPDYKQAQAGDS